MSDGGPRVHLRSRAETERPLQDLAQSITDDPSPERLRKARIRKPIHFEWIYYPLLLLTILNFFLTPNPYSAIHTYYGSGDDNFFVLPSRLMALVLLPYSVNIARYKNNKLIYIMCIIAIASGFLTGRIESKLLTYGLIVVSLLGTSTMALHDGLLDSAQARIVGFLSLTNLIVWVLGLVTMKLLPETSGWFSIALSRDSRSEITLWYMTGLYAVFPCLCVINIINKRNGLSKLFWVVMLIVNIFIVLCCARRAWIIQATIPILLGVIFSRSSLWKMAAIAVLGACGVAAFYTGVFDKFIELFFLTTSGNQISFEQASNGRASLWEYHIECFMRSPIWGNGAYMIDYHRDKESLAFLKGETEIGAMSLFSEFGLPFGLLALSISMVALVRTLGMMKRALTSKQETFVAFLAMYYVSNYGLFLIESNTIIFNPESFVFWYAMMFFFYKKKA